jgi:hypothetical protein
MAKHPEKPTPFLWVLRALISLTLLGYLGGIYIGILIDEPFLSGNLTSDLLAIGMLILFVAGYMLVWMRMEGTAGVVFILFFTALWPLDIYIGGSTFDGAPVFGTIVLIQGILFIAYRISQGKANRKDSESNHSG